MASCIFDVSHTNSALSLQTLCTQHQINYPLLGPISIPCGRGTSLIE
jgi:hypothetical protein